MKHPSTKATVCGRIKSSGWIRFSAHLAGSSGAVASCSPGPFATPGCGQRPGAGPGAPTPLPELVNGAGCSCCVSWQSRDRQEGIAVPLPPWQIPDFKATQPQGTRDPQGTQGCFNNRALHFQPAPRGQGGERAGGGLKDVARPCLAARIRQNFSGCVSLPRRINI